MSTLHLSKTERIDVRASTPVKQLLQEAARVCHKNISEFLLDAGVTVAAQTYVCCQILLFHELFLRWPCT